MNIQSIRKITISVSIILHILFVLSFKTLNSIRLFSKNDPEINLNEQEKRIKFELVETPDNAKSEQPPENTNLLSDKNSIARDRNTEADKYPGLPYARGEMDVKNLDASNLNTGDQQQDQLAANDLQQINNNELQEETDYSSQSYNNAQFSRQALLAKNSPSQQSLKRPNYDNDKFSANEIGGLSFNTYAWDFAPYMLTMKRKVERNVFPPPAFTHMGLINGRTMLRFKVMPNGEVKDLKVLKYEGHKSLMETSVKAIQSSSPFKQLPADFPENYLEVTATFTYDVRR